MSKIILEQKAFNGFPLERVEFDYEEDSNIYEIIDCVIRPLLFSAGFSAKLIDEALGKIGEHYDTDEV